MGAGPKMPYPKWVWTPVGGWYCNPPNMNRNLAFAAVGYAVICSWIFSVSASLERRPVPPKNFIPSQIWCKHAAEDDPRLQKK